MKFVKFTICEPILSSQFKFERFEVKWDPEALPDLNKDKDGQDILTDPRIVQLQTPLQNYNERQHQNSNNPASNENTNKVIFCI